jgi:hypothetical protein
MCTITLNYFLRSKISATYMSMLATTNGIRTLVYIRVKAHGSYGPR